MLRYISSLAVNNTLVLVQIILPLHELIALLYKQFCPEQQEVRAGS